MYIEHVLERGQLTLNKSHQKENSRLNTGFIVHIQMYMYLNTRATISVKGVIWYMSIVYALLIHVHYSVITHRK